MFSSSLVALALAATPEVGLDEAIVLALAGNAQLKVARAEVELARAQVPLAHDWDMPKLRVMVNDAQDVPPVSSAGTPPSRGCRRTPGCGATGPRPPSRSSRRRSSSSPR